MADKKFNFTKSLFRLVMIIPDLLRFLTNIGILVEIETQVLGKRLAKLVVFAVVALALLTSTWLCLSAMGFVYLLSLNLGPLTALSIIFLIHIVLLLVLGFFIKRPKKNSLYKATRESLQKLARH